MFLAGDIGGTSTRLGLYSSQGGYLCVEAQEQYPSIEFDSLEAALELFIRDNNAQVDSICLGVPGPVRNGHVQLTNLPWQFSEGSVAQSLSIDRVRIVNDLYAVSAAIPLMSESDFITLHEGGNEYAKDRFTVLAPGTGLGHSSAAKVRGEWEVFSSEGGHIDFAPRDELSLELLRFLFQKFQKRVSYERVLCGPGIVNIYEFLGTRREYADSDELVTEDFAREIAEKGLSGESPRAVKTLEMFVRSLGGLAGNCVLYNLCTAGIYLGGGIPPKILPKLQDGALVEEYLRQGRMSPIVMDTPLKVVINDGAGLLGAAALAMAPAPAR
jgi:glucokinase